MFLLSRSLAVVRMPSSQLDVLLIHHFQRLQTVVGLEGLVPLAGEVDLQGGDNVPVVVTDENVVQLVHLMSEIILARKL